MSNLNINRTLFGLLIFVVAVLIINPRIFMNLYTTVLGRIALIIFVILLAMHSLAFGLLAALIVIISAQLAFKEGLDTMSDTTSPVTPAVMPTVTPAVPVVPTLATIPSASTMPSDISDIMAQSTPLNPPNPTTIPTTKPKTTTVDGMVDRITADETLRPRKADSAIQSSEEFEPSASSSFKSQFSLV